MRVSIFSFILWLYTLAIHAATVYQYPSGAMNVRWYTENGDTEHSWEKSATPTIDKNRDSIRTYFSFVFGKHSNSKGRMCRFSFYGAETSTCKTLGLFWPDPLRKGNIKKKEIPNGFRAIGTFNSPAGTKGNFTGELPPAFNCPSSPDQVLYAYVEPPKGDPCESKWKISSKGLVIDILPADYPVVGG